jgi:hypothetical protein
MILSSSDPVKYYDPSLNVLRLESLKDARQREILVIPYTAGIYGLDYKTLLNKNGYQLNKEVSFREITYERWAK